MKYLDKYSVNSCNSDSVSTFEMFNHIARKDEAEMVELSDLEKFCCCESPMPTNLLPDINRKDNVINYLPPAVIQPHTSEFIVNDVDVNMKYYSNGSKSKINANSPTLLKVDYGCPNIYYTSKSDSAELLLDRKQDGCSNETDVQRKSDKLSRSDRFVGYFFQISNDKKVFGLTAAVIFIVGLSLGSIFGLGALKKNSHKASQCPIDRLICESVECRDAFRSTFCNPTTLMTCSNNNLYKDFCADFNYTDSIWRDLEKEDSKWKNYNSTTSNNEIFMKDASGWVYFDKGSLNGSKYIIVSKFMTFQVAQDYCKKVGGHLVHINSIREQIFVEDYLSSELKSDSLPPSIGYWLGARRPRGGHSGMCMYEQWKWIDAYGRTHGTIKGFTAFVPGKPDNLYYPEECLYLTVNEGKHESRYLKWDDAMCDLPNAGILTFCEVELFQQR
ncbi:hypothetical protein HELRODRAFT_168268 [Helobdella robusta]|uniref:C-type lectin domain-containing protein n=1 Tax=Helobdella robusta TaxID=6412 RepID=T1F0D5_HELRO|nr:hypothetical protein HELRODRAFT_168268 [Helobdella robusta]ESO09305.1 hypothetical protein HELRODRAFT_168268 [Helobdella robusta]